MDYYTLITGASGFLGSAFARECASLGHNLILTGTNGVKLDKIVSEIESGYKNVKVLSKICDLSKSESRNEFFEYIKENNASVNLLINNAGYIAEGDFLSFQEQDLLNIIRVNCEGTVDVTQKVIRMKGEHPLSIITISSMAGDYPMPHMSMYSATKAMLTNLMVSLAYEVKSQGIYVTTICPSGIPTTKAMQDAIKSQGFGGKITACSPEKIVKVALKASKKHKILVRPKMINAFLGVISRPLSEKFKAKIVGKRWEKSNKKRNKQSENK